VLSSANNLYKPALTKIHAEPGPGDQSLFYFAISNTTKVLRRLSRLPFFLFWPILAQKPCFSRGKPQKHAPEVAFADHSDNSNCAK
jgi:hypothetical protein